MPDVTVVYWRDIPAQVIVGKGRRGAKVQLPWRKAAPYPVEGEQGEVAAAEAARLEAEYDQDRIKQLISNDGWA